MQQGRQAFDWPRLCRIDSAAVYATAGMRFAEQSDMAASRKIWNKLNRALANRLDMQVVTRTLSGFEEGLFAWLAIRDRQHDSDFGIAEMGGASVQITFPCEACESSRPVRVNGQSLPVFSYSFQGYGQDEAWRKYRDRPSCEHGAAIENRLVKD